MLPPIFTASVQFEEGIPFCWIYLYLAISFIEAGFANKKNNLPSGGPSSPEIVVGAQKSF